MSAVARSKTSLSESEVAWEDRSYLRETRSSELFARAQKIFPGGVNSPVRAFRQVGDEPFYVARGEGPYLFDVEGNRYIDCVLSWGPLVMGHAHPVVTDAIATQAQRGTSFGACHEGELQLAEIIQAALPSLEMLRFVNSGTEAGMSVIRLARAFTGRRKIVKFTGCYHGHVDSLLAQAGSGVATLGLPDSAGVIADTTAHTILARYNDLASVVRCLDQYGSDIAAVIVEPVMGNAGLIPPHPTFLQSLRDLTHDYGVLLIFDEVMSGFRVHPAGAQVQARVRPDLSMLGKVIGGGLPVGAYGGRAEIMEMIAPAGSVYQAGTLSGNPLAMAAGRATLTLWGEGEHFLHAAEAARVVTERAKQCAQRLGIPLTTAAAGSMAGLFFHEGPVDSYEDAQRCDRDRFAAFFRGMRARGVFIPPSPFEAWFMSALHSGPVLMALVDAVEGTLEDIARAGR
jgi:glutamate-1-semialdehyde 2,1-aminomutase